MVMLRIKDGSKEVLNKLKQGTTSWCKKLEHRPGKKGGQGSSSFKTEKKIHHKWKQKCKGRFLPTELVTEAILNYVWMENRGGVFRERTQKCKCIE